MADADAVFEEAELVLKVKEPQQVEVGLRAGQTLFTYLHLAAEPELARGYRILEPRASHMRRSRTPRAGCRCLRR